MIRIILWYTWFNAIYFLTPLISQVWRWKLNYLITHFKWSKNNIGSQSTSQFEGGQCFKEVSFDIFWICFPNYRLFLIIFFLNRLSDQCSWISILKISAPWCINASLHLHFIPFHSISIWSLCYIWRMRFDKDRQTHHWGGAATLYQEDTDEWQNKDHEPPDQIMHGPHNTTRPLCCLWYMGHTADMVRVHLSPAWREASLQSIQSYPAWSPLSYEERFQSRWEWPLNMMTIHQNTKWRIISQKNGVPSLQRRIESMSRCTEAVVEAHGGPVPQ